MLWCREQLSVQVFQILPKPLAPVFPDDAISLALPMGVFPKRGIQQQPGRKHYLIGAGCPPQQAIFHQLQITQRSLHIGAIFL